MSHDGALVAKGAAVTAAWQVLVVAGLLVFGGFVVGSWVACWLGTAKAVGPARRRGRTFAAAFAANMLVSVLGMASVGALLDGDFAGSVNIVVATSPAYLAGAAGAAALARRRWDRREAG